MHEENLSEATLHEENLSEATLLPGSQYMPGTRQETHREGSKLITRLHAYSGKNN
jgi:hypothetical protein